MRLLLLTLALCACGKTEPIPAPEQVVTSDASGLQDGAACLTGDQCASGVCEGQGCTDDLPGICISAERVCTMDVADYCGCDGRTFQASGSCPGRRFDKRGACDADKPSEPERLEPEPAWDPGADNDPEQPEELPPSEEVP